VSVTSKLAGFIEALRREPDAFDAMPPAERRRLADVLRYIANLAEPAGKADTAKTGVLADLRGGRQA
jgi:hypothetical protein